MYTTYTIERKTITGEKLPNLDICIFNLISVVCDTKTLSFVVSLLVVGFAMSLKNNNRCDDILVSPWEAGNSSEGMGITNGTGKMGIKPR